MHLKLTKGKQSYSTLAYVGKRGVSVLASKQKTNYICVSSYFVKTSPL